jgi:hypothetical protein
LLGKSQLVQFLVRASLGKHIGRFNGSVDLGAGDKSARVVANDKLGSLVPLSLVAKLVLNFKGLVVTSFKFELLGLVSDFLFNAFG